MLDFPANPTPGQQFTAAGVTWTWDSVKWTSGGQSVAYLPLAGGTMLGPIVLAADPAAALQPATKQYVDGVRLGDNRVINGDMRIDQRNNGASGTASGYTVDRWQYSGSQVSKGGWQRVAFNAFGFPYALVFSSSSAYALLAADVFGFLQIIEADMVSDFQWGTASAQPVVLSFVVLSSLTGTFSGSIRNAAFNRSYPFTFSIPTANTATKIGIAIPGDTAGTWVMSGNAGSVILAFSLGAGTTSSGPANAWAAANYVGATGAVSVVGTNGATFYVTGVKLETGSVATPFNHPPLAQALAACQRYYQVWLSLITTAYVVGAGGITTPTIMFLPMRTTPTAIIWGQSYGNASAISVTPVATGSLSANARTALTASAAGNAYAQYNLALDAEL